MSGYGDTTKKNGELMYVNISSQVVEYADRKCELILSIDQTERVKILESSKHNEGNLTSILNSMSDVIWSSDPNAMEILLINKNVIDLYGYPSEAFYENLNLWLDCVLGEDKQRVMDAANSLKYNGSYEEEYRIIAKNGDIK